MAVGRKTYIKPAPRVAAPKFDYKNVELLKKYLNPHGQLLSRKRTGFDNQGQTALKSAVKRARLCALLPFVG